MIEKFYALVAIDVKRSADYDEMNITHNMPRTVGFYPTIEEAEADLKEYSEHIWELTARYAAIEAVNFGLMQMHREEIKWYSYNECMSLYLSCKRPPLFSHIVSLWS